MLRFFRSRQFWPHAGLRPTVYPISSQSRTPASLRAAADVGPARASDESARVVRTQDASKRRLALSISNVMKCSSRIARMH